MATRVTAKGQVTIPKRIRDGLGLRPGSAVEFLLEEGHAVLELARERGAAALAGSLRAYAKAVRGRGDSEVMEKMRREVADEAAKKGLPPRHKRPS